MPGEHRSVAPRAIWGHACAWLGGFLSACSGDGGAPAPDAHEPGWARYEIPRGAHDAMLIDREPKNPIDGVTSVIGRDYELALDPSAIYELTEPVEPEDQLDWNKLPGLSDCGDIDLSINGLMFGWRWRLDVAPPRLEITAYANNDGVHLTAPAPLVTLDADDLAAAQPLRYRVYREPSAYRFAIEGVVRDRPIQAAAMLPRGCTAFPIDEIAWAAGFYFGGTSTAPHEITARIREAAWR